MNHELLVWLNFIIYKFMAEETVDPCACIRCVNRLARQHQTPLLNMQKQTDHFTYQEMYSLFAYWTLIYFDPANVDKYTIHWVSGWLSCVSPCQQIPLLHASEIHCNDGWPPSILGHCSVVNCTTPSRFRRVSSKSIRWIGWFFVGCLCLGIFFVDFFYDFCKLNRCFEFMHPLSPPRVSQILCWILLG